MAAESQLRRELTRTLPAEGQCRYEGTGRSDGMTSGGVTPGPLQRAELVTADIFASQLEAFVYEHYPRLVRLAGLVCRNGDEAQDAVQAALERAWRGRSSLKDTARIKPWLDRIVVRESIRQGAWRLRFPWSSASSESREIEAPGLNATRLAEDADLKVAFRRLPPAQRAVVTLHLYAGYTLPECADLLGIPLETARSRLRLARERLRRAIGEELR